MIAKAAKEGKVVALRTKFVDAKAAILADYSDLMSNNWQSYAASCARPQLNCMS